MNRTFLEKLMGFFVRFIPKILLIAREKGKKDEMGARHKFRARQLFSILAKLIQKLKSSTEVWSMRAPGLCSSKHPSCLIQPLFQILRHSRQVDKKIFSIQAELLICVHLEHTTQSHGFRFGAGVCLAGQLCMSQCTHTIIQERE